MIYSGSFLVTYFMYSSVCMLIFSISAYRFSLCSLFKELVRIWSVFYTDSTFQFSFKFSLEILDLLYWCKSHCGFKPWISLWLGSNTSLLIKIGTIIINIFLPKKNKFAYSCSIKIHTSGFNELLERMLCLLLIVEAFSLQKGVKMLKW